MELKKLMSMNKQEFDNFINDLDGNCKKCPAILKCSEIDSKSELDCKEIIKLFLEGKKIMRPCPCCEGEVTGYSSGATFSFFIRCNRCGKEYPLKTKIVLFKNSSTKITKTSINKAYGEWNTYVDRLKALGTEVEK